MGESYEIKQNKEWERVRYIVYGVFTASINGMNGKPNFKNIKTPKDIFPLPQDTKTTGKVVKIDKERQAKSVARHKRMMAKK